MNDHYSTVRTVDYFLLPATLNYKTCCRLFLYVLVLCQMCRMTAHSRKQGVLFDAIVYFTSVAPNTRNAQ
jgi:hypothetical protein